MLSDLDRQLAAFASAQYGLFKRSQAHEIDVDDRRLQRRVSRGSLERLSPNVFRIAGASSSWHQRLLAAAWAGGDDCYVSHRSAGALHPFDGFRPDRVEVVHHQRHDYRSRDDIIVHVTSVLDVTDRVMIGPIPVTNPVRTLIDLGAVLKSERLEEVLDTAERDGLVDRSELIARHAQIRQSGRNGVGVLAEILDRRHATAAMPQSVLERRMLRLLAGANLPRPECQLRVPRADGRVAFLDLAYPHIQLGIELDGHAYHSTVRQRQRDNERQNQVVMADWKILRFTYNDVAERPEYVVNEVRRALVVGSARYPVSA